MTILTPEYEIFKAQVEEKRKALKKKQAKLDAEYGQLATLLSKCLHEELEIKESYFSGSYYDKASIDRWYQCKICGSAGPKTTEVLSYYG